MLDNNDQWINPQLAILPVDLAKLRGHMKKAAVELQSSWALVAANAFRRKMIELNWCPPAVNDGDVWTAWKAVVDALHAEWLKALDDGIQGGNDGTA